jgi:hypothetical protein
MLPELTFTELTPYEWLETALAAQVVFVGRIPGYVLAY